MAPPTVGGRELTGHGTSDAAGAPRRLPRLTAARAVMVAGIGLAAALAAIPILAGGGGTAQVAPPRGPALRLADRAGLVTVNLAARATSLEVRTFPSQGVEVGRGSVRVRAGRDGDAPVDIATADCGAGCHLARIRLRPGVWSVAVVVAPRGAKPAAAAFSVPWPLGPGRDRLLRRAVASMARLRAVTVHERVTSDPRRGYTPSPTVTLTGRELLGAETYALGGARDVREIPGGGALRRIAYAIPPAHISYQLWVGPDGLIRRERIVGPNHLIERRFSRFRPPPRAGAGPGTAAGGVRPTA
ncbi:MAG: hypothetical protein AB1416_01035 [Actinomycetota bacterium]